MQHRVLKYYQICSNDDPGLTMTYFMARSNLVPYVFVWENGKTMKFLENIVVYDIKVGICSQSNEYMKLYEYQRSSSFIDLHPRSLDSTSSNFFSLETLIPTEAKFHAESPWDGKMNMSKNGLCHMTKIADMSIYGKKL